MSETSRGYSPDLDNDLENDPDVFMSSGAQSTSVGDARPVLSLVRPETAEEKKYNDAQNQIAKENAQNTHLDTVPTLATPEMIQAFEAQRKQDIERADAIEQQKIAQARELFKTMEAKKRNAEIARARQKVEEIPDFTDDITEELDTSSTSSIPETPKVAMRGTPVRDLGRTREVPLTVEQNAFKGMQNRISNEISRLQTDLKLSENPQLGQELENSLRQFENLNSTNNTRQALELGEKIIFRIQQAAEQNKKAARETRGNIILSNPKAPTGFFSKVKSFFGFGGK